MKPLSLPRLVTVAFSAFLLRLVLAPFTPLGGAAAMQLGLILLAVVMPRMRALRPATLPPLAVGLNDVTEPIFHRTSP